MVSQFVCAPPPRGRARHRQLERQLQRFRPEHRASVQTLALVDDRLADLAISFPALALALAVPRHDLARFFVIDDVIAGRDLKWLAKGARVPLWLRTFPPEMLSAPLPELPSGQAFSKRIVNHFPRSAELGPGWLGTVASAARWSHEAFAIWCARHFSAEFHRGYLKHERPLHLWSWFSAHPGTLAHDIAERKWNGAIECKAALSAAEIWRTTALLHADFAGQEITDVWLTPGVVNGFEFVSLHTETDIAAEARAMKNCLRIHGGAVVHNRARLWSVRKDGRRVATVRIGARFHQPLPELQEIKGPWNAEAPVEVVWATRKWLHQHDLLAVNMNRCAWHSVQPNRATWNALWKPYWLAKRHIPSWLPIAPSRFALEAL
jgi:hypothetical protein